MQLLSNWDVNKMAIWSFWWHAWLRMLAKQSFSCLHVRLAILCSIQNDYLGVANWFISLNGFSAGPDHVCSFKNVGRVGRLGPNLEIGCYLRINTSTPNSEERYNFSAVPFWARWKQILKNILTFLSPNCSSRYKFSKKPERTCDISTPQQNITCRRWTRTGPNRWSNGLLGRLFVSTSRIGCCYYQEQYIVLLSTICLRCFYENRRKLWEKYFPLAILLVLLHEFYRLKVL